MEKKQKSFAKRLTSRILIWVILVVLVLSYIILHFEVQATRQFYSEIYHNKMLITYEYTRRVISDVYVAVTNNIYYLEHSLDNPDSHKETMKRIVSSGTRVRSCGISFIQDYYYPKKESHFCPFAWRSAANPDVIETQDMGDADLDYLTADWFLDIVKSDSAQWSEPFYDGYDETTTLSAYMVPIHDQTGRVVAVLGADVSLNWLTNKLSEADTIINRTIMVMASKFEMKSTSFIINHDGAYITHIDGKRIMKDNFFKQLETCNGSNVEGVINKMVNGLQDNKSQERFLVDGEECLLFYTPIKYTRWIMVTVVPCKSIDILSYLNGVTVLFIILLSMLLIVIVVYYYMKRASEPLKQLTKVADDITAGKYDTPMPEIKHNDEISQLRDSLEGVQYMLSNFADNGRKQ